LLAKGESASHALRVELNAEGAEGAEGAQLAPRVFAKTLQDGYTPGCSSSLVLLDLALFLGHIIRGSLATHTCAGA
jgi:hypothetical protein